MASQKVKKRFSLESQFHGHRPFKDVVNPLKPSEKCHELQVITWAKLAKLINENSKD